MNRCHALGHLAVIVAGLAGAVMAFAAVPALASASPRPARLLSALVNRVSGGCAIVKSSRLSPSASAAVFSSVRLL